MDTYILCASLDMLVFCNDDLVVTIIQMLMWIFKSYVKNNGVCFMMATSTYLNY